MQTFSFLMRMLGQKRGKSTNVLQLHSKQKDLIPPRCKKPTAGHRSARLFLPHNHLGGVCGRERGQGVDYPPVDRVPCRRLLWQSQSTVNICVDTVYQTGYSAVTSLAQLANMVQTDVDFPWQSKKVFDSYVYAVKQLESVQFYPMTFIFI